MRGLVLAPVNEIRFMASNQWMRTLRTVKRNPVVFMINVSGLALGLATCLVAALYIKHEYSVDKFHPDIENIFRVSVKYRAFEISGSPYLFAEAANSEITGITDALRTAQQKITVKVNDKLFKDDAVFADPNFFTFFQFRFHEGNPLGALNSIRKVVITAEQKTKLFGEASAVGKIVQIKTKGSFEDFEVSGVTEDIPANSSISFNYILPLEYFYFGQESSKNDWTNFRCTTFLKLQAGELSKVESAFQSFAKTHMPSDGDATRFVLQPLGSHHLANGSPGAGLIPGRSNTYVLVFAAVSAVILMLACFNFAILTNAQSATRSLEVGVRKISGAGRMQLIYQFLGETVAVTVFASLIALGLAELALFAFRDLLDVPLSLFSIRNADVFLGLVVVAALTGVASGIYPAVMISGVNAIASFKKQFRLSGDNWLTRFVLGTQFMVAAILIACAIIMWRQQRFLITSDLGFKQDGVVIVPFVPADTVSVPVLKEQLSSLPSVASVSETSSAFTRGNDVSVSVLPDGAPTFIYMQSIDEKYLSTMRMEVMRGRNFSEHEPAAESRVLVNEALLKRFNLEDSIGIRLGRSIGMVPHPTIIGVVRDFHHNDLRSPIQPYVFLYNKPLHDKYLVMRLHRGSVSRAIDDIRSLWQNINPDSPFDYFFLDQDIELQYQDERRWSTIITISTGMAIFLSVLGLIGSAMYTAERRRKEVGIRKVLGASVEQMMLLLSRSYGFVLLLSFIVSAPVSYWIMQNFWLKNFAYKTTIDLFVYIITLAVITTTVGLAVSTQTIRAARQNPADTLKDE